MRRRRTFRAGAELTRRMGPKTWWSSISSRRLIRSRPPLPRRIVSTNNDWLYNHDNLLDMPAGDVFHIEMNYSALTRRLDTTTARNGAQYGQTQTITVPTNFDFRVAAVSVSSYSDQNSDGSILAHGWVDNLVVAVPPAAGGKPKRLFHQRPMAGRFYQPNKLALHVRTHHGFSVLDGSFHDDTWERDGRGSSRHKSATGQSVLSRAGGEAMKSVDPTGASADECKGPPLPNPLLPWRRGGGLGSSARVCGSGDGFTLMELLVVMAVIAALAALLLPRIVAQQGIGLSAEMRQQSTPIGSGDTYVLGR